MNEVSFDEEAVGRPRQSSSRESALERYLVQYSFGLITTKAQAAMAQVMLAVLLLIVFVILLFRSTATNIEQPTDELINAEQPTRPISR